MFVRGGRQRLTPRGHGELHALAAHGDRGLQIGRVAGGHGGCGVWEIALRSARVRGVPVGVSNRREPAIFNNSGPNRPRGKGARLEDVLAPSPVASDKMLAATCGAAWWAGFTPRGIPIWRVAGSLARIGVRAKSCCLRGSPVEIFLDSDFRLACSMLPRSVRTASRETRRPCSHPLAPRCPRVRSGYSPAGGSFRAPLRVSSAMRRPVDARAPVRSGRGRACPPPRAASAGREIGTRNSTAAPCRCGG
jgi:hypothetical protein